MIDLIRRDLGFQGLLMSDDIGMQALSGTMTQRAGAIIAAGCDLVLSCNETLAQMDEIVAASGRMTPRALARAGAALALRHAPQLADAAMLRAELTALGGLAA